MAIVPAIRYLDTANVSTFASDSNDGLTLTTPWLTLSKAIDAAPAGSIVYVRAATWTSLTVSGKGSSRKRTAKATIRPYRGEAVGMTTPTNITFSNCHGFRIVGIGRSDEEANGGGFAFEDGCTRVNVVGCEIRSVALASGGGDGAPCKHIHVTDNEIARFDGSTSTHLNNWQNSDLDNPMEWLFLRRNTLIGGGTQVRFGGVRNVEVTDNDCSGVVQEGGVDPPHTENMRTYSGSGLAAANIAFRRNVFHNNDTPQILFFKDGAVYNLTIENNLHHSTFVGGPNPSSNAFANIYNAHGVRILHNTSVIGGVIWQFHTAESDGIVFANNVLPSHSESGATPVFLYRDYNVLYVSSGFAAETNGETDDPVFVDAAGGNYDLANGSPGLNAGVASPTGAVNPPIDRLLRARPFGAAPDMGCNERQS